MQQNNDLNIGLVLLAAGFGTRFGGNKQLSMVGPENAIIMDYTIYDAWRIGYSWVTVILRKEIVDQFEAEVGQRWHDKIDLRYSIQDRDTQIPAQWLTKSYVAQRQKPWGTAHALLCAESQVSGPFAVANADDFYGYHGLKEIFFFLRSIVLQARNNNIPSPVPDWDSDQAETLVQAMVGFQLGKTLSQHGTVSRGICHTYFDDKGSEWLDHIEEHIKLIRGEDHKIRSIQSESDEDLILSETTPVSMNLFGLQPKIFPHLQRQFESFLQKLDYMLCKKNLEQALKTEFYLPSAVESMLEGQQSVMTMLHSPDPWFGLTYLEDMPVVRANIQSLIRSNQYPKSLFTKEAVTL